MTDLKFKNLGSGIWGSCSSKDTGGADADAYVCDIEYTD
jgi:hypothetical protein